MINKQFIGVWFDTKEITPPKKGVYLTWVSNEKERILDKTYWNGSFWELTRIGKIRGFEVVYWTHQPPYPTEM